ncbi:MAG: nitrate- and nitrite sensing domain-containing protein [Acidimicrobiales bacterium]
MRYLTPLTTKLTVLVALPLIALLVVAALGVQRASRAVAREQATADAVDLALAAATVARHLTLEGELSAGEVAAETQRTSARLSSQRQKTDKAADALEHAVDDAGDASQLHLADTLDGLDRLDDLREAVDERRDTPDDILEQFASIAEPALATDRLLGNGTTADTTMRLDAYLALTRAIYAMVREQSVVEGMLRSGIVDPAAYIRLVEVGTSQRHWLERFEDIAPTEDLERYRDAEAAPASGRLVRLRDHALAAGPGGEAGGDPMLWSRTAARRIDALSTVARETASNLSAKVAAADSAAASRRSTAWMWFVAALALVLGLLALVHHLVLAPMRRLSRASHPATETLPKAVELAETKRETMNTVFLNFGRRTQALVSQQLSHIDSLESRADNPDTLADLFILDHLATRLRRNAESLVVLAGAASPRPWARPVSVTNLVRAAAAEAADYSRVDVVPMAPAMVAGACANDVSHLIAELIDTALETGPRGARVTISGGAVGGGDYLIAVADVSSGLSSRQLAEANALIARTPLAGVGKAGYFGLFVVGQIARRYDIGVQLVRSAGGRVAAEVLLPRALVLDREPSRQAATLSLTTFDEPPGCMVTP